MDEKIDILMATYNGAKYVKEQIDSILSQTYSNFRLLICDDVSNDGTYEILKEYEKKDKRVIVYRNEKNLGCLKNFENLLTKVQSNCYMFSDQDDVWYNTKIEDTLKKMVSDNADLVFTDLEIVDDKLNTKYDSFNKKMEYRRKILKLDDYNMVYLYNVVTGCTILSKKKYINKILPLPNNKNMLHDHFISLVVSLSGGKISYLDKATIKYRQHDNNQVGAKKYTSTLKSFDDVRNHLIEVKLSIFKEYVNINEMFDEKTRKLNVCAFEYYNYLKSVKNISIKYVNIYFKLYKYEKLSYILLYLFVFHFPIFGKIGFKLLKLFKKKKI